MADATMKLLRDLEDPSLFHKVEAVPAFVPHKRTKRDQAGNLHEVAITKERLQKIARHQNEREAESGTLAIVTLGHRFQGQDVPEAKQPPVVGFCRNWRVGTFGPKSLPCLLYDEYVKQKDKAEAGSFPFRSVEFYPLRDEITAVCKLVRDGELDLGQVVYGNSDAVLAYSRETQMDPTMPPDANAVDTPPAPVEPEGDEMDQFAKHCMANSYGRKLHGAMTKYAMEGAAAPAVPGPTNGLPAPAPLPDEGAEQFQRRLQASQYQRRLEAAEAKATAAEQRVNLLTYERDLTQLLALGYEFDLAAELVEVKDLSPEQFSRHKGRIEKNYSRGPVGDQTPVRVATTAGPGKAEFGERELETCARYMREHPGMAWAEAKAKVQQAA